MKKGLLFAFLLHTLFVSSQTNVSGGIYTNTTWTKANSPYIVTGIVSVYPGVKLTIEPGVEVRFNDSTYLLLRTATLNATGNSTDTITFTSNSTNPHAGLWNGIAFRDSSTINLAYCNIKYAQSALLPLNPPFTPLIIKNVTFTSNNSCLSDASFDKPCIIDSCLFKSNGIGINQIDHTNISQSIFIDNGTAVSSLDYSSINYCNFCGNGTGVYQTDTIRNCSFSDNHIAFVNQFRYMKGCIFTNNDTALYCSINPQDLLSHNSICNNHIGILLENNYSTTGVFSNNICGNTIYNVRYTLTDNCVLRNNCWCTTDSAAIALKIYDGYDDLSLGFVDFSNFLNCDSSVIPAPSLCSNVLNGIENYFEENHDIKVYPNPAFNYFILSFSSSLNQNTHLEIYNSLGEKYLTEAENHFPVSVDCSRYPAGMYFVKLSNNEQVQVSRVVVE